MTEAVALVTVAVGDRDRLSLRVMVAVGDRLSLRATVAPGDTDRFVTAADSGCG